MQKESRQERTHNTVRSPRSSRWRIQKSCQIVFIRFMIWITSPFRRK